MATIQYKFPARSRGNTKKVIQRTNDILAEYEQQGLVLTLRQLYYQHVARGYLPNTNKSYKRLGKIVGDARLAGKIDWERLEDRTRNLQKLQHFTGPQDALDKLARWYHVDMWANQDYRPECWIEKDALAGVIESVCQENDIPYFSCRGYTSLSEMWRASTRLRHWAKEGYKPYIIHFGDHDPSGIDMSRDILERLRDVFMADCKFERVALTMDQVNEYQPPPNPAKVTDSRYKVYLERFGDESWELDALEPTKFRTLITGALDAIRNKDAWEKDAAEKERVRQQLLSIGKEWQEIEPRKLKLQTAGMKIESLEKKLKDTEESLKALKAERRKRKKTRGKDDTK